MINGAMVITLIRQFTLQQRTTFPLNGSKEMGNFPIIPHNSLFWVIIEEQKRVGRTWT